MLEIKRVLFRNGKYIGIEGIVNRKLRPFVKVFTGAQYRTVSEGVREDMYDSQSWQKVFAKVGMRSTVEVPDTSFCIQEPHWVEVIPRSYRPRYKLRYPYERILSMLHGQLQNS